MPNGFQGVTDAIGGILGSPIVQLGFRAIAIYWIVFWLAASYWAFRDLQLRTDNAVLPYLAAAFIIVFTPLLFPAAIVIYRIVRPHEKIDEVYERTLAQEAMLAEIETVPTCPTCRRRVNDQWLICPVCRSRLNRVCPNCDRVVGLDWTLCAWCGRDFAPRHEPAPAPVSRPAVERRPAEAQRAPSSPPPARAVPPPARPLSPQATPMAQGGLVPATAMGSLMSAPMAAPMATPMAAPLSSAQTPGRDRSTDDQGAGPGASPAQPSPPRSRQRPAPGSLSDR